MVHPAIENPLCKSIALQFLLAHAERPSLLGSSSDQTLRAFAQKESFYSEFVALVGERMPEYTEASLLETKTWMPQRDYNKILDCFKEVSGIWNPLHYQEMGRLIPTVGDALTQLATTVGGTENVIRLSERFNADFNNDQRIVVERLEHQERKIHATVQHYFLPRLPANPPYFEMVTAALGYWEGIPSLWGWPVNGKVKLAEIQLTLEELIKRDYAYLELDYHENGDDILINGKKAAQKIHFGEDPLTVLGYHPQESFLEKSLSAYTPAVMLEDVFAQDELIFARDTKYGMPCNRYHIEVPVFDLARRSFYFMKGLYYSIEGWLGLHSQERGYQIKVRRPTAVLLSDSLEQVKKEADDKWRAKLDAQEARTDALEAKLSLEQQVSGVNKVFGDIRTLAHDNKNTALNLLSEARNLLAQTLQEHPSYQPRTAVFQSDEILPEGLAALQSDNTAPSALKLVAAYVHKNLTEVQALIENERSIMSGGTSLKIEDILYTDVLNPVVENIARLRPKISIEYTPPVDMHLRGDLHLLKVAFVNLIRNSREASLPNGRVSIKQEQKHRAQRTFTIIDIFQTGYLAPEYEAKLNAGESFTTKSDGNATGAAASYNIIKGTHNGSIQYISLGDQGAQIRVII